MSKQYLPNITTKTNDSLEKLLDVIDINIEEASKILHVTTEYLNSLQYIPKEYIIKLLDNDIKIKNIDTYNPTNNLTFEEETEIIQKIFDGISRHALEKEYLKHDIETIMIKYNISFGISKEQFVSKIKKTLPEKYRHIIFSTIDGKTFSTNIDKIKCFIEDYIILNPSDYLIFNNGDYLWERMIEVSFDTYLKSFFIKNNVNSEIYLNKNMYKDINDKYMLSQKKYKNNFDSLLQKNNLSIEDLSKITKISVKQLKILQEIPNNALFYLTLKNADICGYQSKSDINNIFKDLKDSNLKIVQKSFRQLKMSKVIKKYYDINNDICDNVVNVLERYESKFMNGQRGRLDSWMLTNFEIIGTVILKILYDEEKIDGKRIRKLLEKYINFTIFDNMPIYSRPWELRWHKKMRKCLEVFRKKGYIKGKGVWSITENGKRYVDNIF